MPSHDIIDNRNQKLVDKINCILESSEAAHFAVGYFFISGFTAISDRLNNIKQLRLLIGNTSNRETIEQIAQGYKRLELISDRIEAESYPKRSQVKEIKAETVANVRSDIELLDQTDEAQTLINNLVQMIEEKRLEVKVYTKGTLHAKAYIFDYGKVYDDKGRELARTENGIAAVGSSNLSLAGIEHNTELNVMVHGNDNHAALTDWFEELWSEAEEFDEALMEEMKQSWAVSLATPYDVYMKTLYTLVRDRLEDVAPKDLIVDNEISKQLADFQKVAVKHAIQNIRDYGGTFVADVVGLGKSFIGAAIVKHFEQSEKARPLIICPPPLIDMWERYNEIYHLNARVLSLGMLKQDDDNTFRTLLENYRYKDRDFILIDESHHLRNHGTQRYKVLETFLAAGKRCCLLTATPRNNSAWDIYHQLKLFHQDDLTDLPIDPPNLKEYFRGVEKGDRNLQDLLSHVLIRRTRNQIIRFYGYDAETHQKVIESGNYRDYQTGKRKAYVLVGGQHRFFPKRELETIEYSIEDTYQGLYQQLRSHIGKPRKKQLRNLLKNELSYARYGLWNFVIKEKQNKEPYLTLQRAGSNLRGLIRVLLFKRFESSVCAFKTTVKKLLTIHQNFLAALDAGIVPAGEEAQKLLSQENPEGEEIDLLNALNEVARKYDIEDFNAKKLKKHIEHDVQIFQEILELVEPITPEQDNKLQTLKQWLDKPLLKGKKRLIFTQYEDTAKYLYENLNPDNSIDDIDVIYSSSGKSKALLVAKFAPKANKDYKLKADEPEINTLIATDVLAEGLNMQDGDLIINYDLHWNPVKLIQRFGRIDRIGSEKETIYGFNFLPELGIERNLGLQQKLRNRIQEIHDTIGEDAAILDRNEQLNEEAMYAIYGKQSESENVQLSLFDETEELMELTDAEEILKQLKQDHPEEYDRITKLPNGIRSARFSTKSGTYVFCEASDPNRPDIRSYQKLYLIDKQGNVITEDVSRILGSIKCEPTTPTAKLPQDYNSIVMRIKRQFAEEVKHRQAERDYSSNLTQGQRYVLRELRTLFNFTEDESQKTLINLLDRVFRNHLPQAINRELNALRRNGITGQDLFTHLARIYNQHDLHRLSDPQKLVLKYQPIASIVCSEEFV
ncbi:DNA/RNA helicase, superfamily II [Hyella patelloides LEGE 07179]|uniref:DNA/RNA helicase, superfamily II n=1 Tax=Hyella patelloides LEGE 07179 TaxID=945734 RepID=A0A563VRW5_9CYAN|nr:helicase-related protein [Hyella patelloides]VEP14153.1 DNA/RNA helicase, superfamily II [Hyella patelloides LEGE 07179]